MARSQITGRGPNFKDLVGQTFGRLTVLSFHGISTSGGVIWLCRCECGVEKPIKSAALMPTEKGRRTLSCGCYNRECGSAIRTKHGMSFSITYSSWGAMIKRCNDPGDPGYPAYGGAGIIVCDRWRGEHGFENFHADMGERPSKKYSIDRYPDQGGNYEKDNCRWATVQEQAWNRRSTRMITFGDETLPIVEWARRIGIAPTTLTVRLRKGWPLEEALSKKGDRIPRGVKIYTHEGVSLTLRQWSEHTGINYMTLYSRIRMGWTFEEILKIQPVYGNRRDTYKE